MALSSKNFALSPASSDLGLGAGDALVSQQEETTQAIQKNRKKQLGLNAPQNLTGVDLGPATMSLLGGISGGMGGIG